MSSLSDLLNQYSRILNDQQDQLNNLNAQKQAAYNTLNGAQTLLQQLAGLQPAIGQPVKPKLLPADRIVEIDRELDIIRGRAPTPKGYKINPIRVKELLAERRELSSG